MEMDYVIDLMSNVNHAHNHDVFTDIICDEEEQSIRFEIAPSVGMEHVLQLAGLLNLTFHIEPFINERGEPKIAYYLLP